MTAPPRDFDLVLFGATGFTGALTAEYLASHVPAGTRWALAGRNVAKLEDLRARLLGLAGTGAGGEVAVREADVTDSGSLRSLAAASRVLVTTVGPYLRYGEPLVAACAEAGTDYLDLTGESEFVDRMYVRHHARAVASGARLVHCCGFDSIPHDLGAQFTVEHLPEGVPLRLRGYVSASGLPSGGTFTTAVTAFSRTRQASAAHAERQAAERQAAERRAAEQAPAEPRSAQSEPGARRVRSIAGRPGYDRAAGGWVAPLPTIDPQVVTRSARALERYGPDFAYSHLGVAGNPVVAAGLAAGAAGLFVLAQLPPTRNLLLRLRPPGTGPSPEQRQRAWFRVRFVGEGGGRRVVTEVAGGDPGYGETSKMLAEAALCLASDDMPPTRGQVTTAVAMGKALRNRLESAGISFRVVEESRT